MAQYPAPDLKLYADVKQLLTNLNDELCMKKAGSHSAGTISSFQFPMDPSNPCDEVYPGLFLGNALMAKDPEKLKELGITHIVNVSKGIMHNQTNTDSKYYEKFQMTFYGIPAKDLPAYDLSPYFKPSADFIAEAIDQNGKVYIHCHAGVSRSATIVISFLMQKRQQDLMSAVKCVRDKREIFPNDGFLKQLCQLNEHLFHPKTNMTQTPVNLKLWSNVKEFLKTENDKIKEKSGGPPKLGAFALFSAIQPKNPCDEVYPGIVLGNAAIAKDHVRLKQLGITHLVNASQGSRMNQTDTDNEYYEKLNIEFHGIPALDIMTFKLSPYFNESANFIEKALSDNGKVYVHCQHGMSRSATIVISFLMQKRQQDLMSAVKCVRDKREIFPNDGFLKQLCHLEDQLFHSKKLEAT